MVFVRDEELPSVGEGQFFLFAPFYQERYAIEQ